MLLTNNNAQSEKASMWSGLFSVCAWTIILLGLVSLFFVQSPLRWIMALFWAALIIIAAALQTFYVRYMQRWPFFTHLHAEPMLKSARIAAFQQNVSSLDESTKQLVPPAPQLTHALENPFRDMGVRTENHRQEIDKAVNALCCMPNFDEQAISDCLQGLLQAAKQNWTELAAFSPREREILELLHQNITYKEMSCRLHVSTSTVKTHIYHIFQKLEISNREEAMALIRERGWF